MEKYRNPVLKKLCLNMSEEEFEEKLRTRPDALLLVGGLNMLDEEGNPVCLNGKCNDCNTCLRRLRKDYLMGLWNEEIPNPSIEYLTHEQRDRWGAFQPRSHQQDFLEFGKRFMDKPWPRNGLRRGEPVMLGGITRAERDHAYHAAMTSHIGRFRKNGLMYAFEDINLDAERLKELRLQSEYILQNMRKLTHRAQVVEETTYGSIIKVVRSPVSNSMGKWLLEFLNTPYLYGDPDRKKTATDQGPFIQIQPSGAIHVADKVVGRVDYLGRKMMLNTKHYFGSAHENLTSKVRTLRGSLSGATVDFPDYDHWFKPRPKPPLEAWAEDAVDKMLYQQVYGVDRGYLRAGVLMIPSPTQSLRSMMVQDQKLKARKRLSNPNLMPGRKK